MAADTFTVIDDETVVFIGRARGDGNVYRYGHSSFLMGVTYYVSRVTFVGACVDKRQICHLLHTYQ